MGLTRDEILAASRPKPVKVSTPELSSNGTGHTYVRVLTAEEDLEQLQTQLQSVGDGGLAQNIAVARACAFFACDREGNRLFGEDDVEGLLRLPLAALARIANTAIAVNNLQEDLAGN